MFHRLRLHAMTSEALAALATNVPQFPLATSIESQSISWASGERPSLNDRMNFQP